MARAPYEGLTSRMDWNAHELSVAAVRERLGLPDDDRGLGEAEVAARRATYGANTLPAPVPVTLGAVILHQFLSPLIYILLAAAAVSLALGDLVDAGFILFVVCFNATLGTYQEWRAERSAAA